MTQARIFLVEDDIDTNRHLSSLMKSFDSIEFVGNATTYNNAICFLRDNDIDCLVTDICLPDGSGLDDIMNGGAPISAFMAKHILKSVPHQSEKTQNVTIEIDLPQLTLKEISVLKVIARGYSYKEAADHLNVSPNTIPNHIKNIYRKLQVHSRGEAVYEALRLGIIDKID